MEHLSRLAGSYCPQRAERSLLPSPLGYWCPLVMPPNKELSSRAWLSHALTPAPSFPHVPGAWTQAWLPPTLCLINAEPSAGTSRARPALCSFSSLSNMSCLVPVPNGFTGSVPAVPKCVPGAETLVPVPGSIPGWRVCGTGHGYSPSGASRFGPSRVVLLLPAHSTHLRLSANSDKLLTFPQKLNLLSFSAPWVSGPLNRPHLC